MAFDALKKLPAKDLAGKLNELSQENFKARFTSEPMTSQRGAQILRRRREVARIKTVLSGRDALKAAQAEEKRLAAALKKLGAPHTGGTQEINARRKLQRRLDEAKRTVRELGAIES